MHLLNFSILFFFLAAPPSTGSIYIRSKQQLNKGLYQSAAKGFQRVLSSLESNSATKTKGSQTHTSLLFGQCDTLYYLAESQWQMQQKRTSCLSLLKLSQRIRSLPSGWKTLYRSQELPRRLEKGISKLKGRCSTVPSILNLKIEASSGKKLKSVAVMSREGTRSWKKEQTSTDSVWKVETTKQSLSITISADGYKIVTKQYTLEKWSSKSVSIRLQILPFVSSVKTPSPRKKIALKVIPKLREVPVKKATPVYKKVWFWSVIGGAAVIGTTTALVLTAKQRHVFQAGKDKDYYKLW